MMIPKWKRGDGSDRLGNHMYAESIYERQVGDVLQVIERIRPHANLTQDTRPFYRYLEVSPTNGAKIVGIICDAQKDARTRADKRAARMLKTSASVSHR